MLSSRGYSLERRFAQKLAHIMILKTLTASSNFLGRKVGQLAVPQWFIEGLTLQFAFPADTLQISRLIDMARHKRLYNLRQLAGIMNQPEMIREEMLFQAHSMITFWEETYKKNAALTLMKSVYKSPSNFTGLFKASYGVSINEAFNSYISYVENLDNKLFPAHRHLPDELSSKIDGKYFRSYRSINTKESVWVSSKRYSTETYDLYYKNSLGKQVVLLKNVHPLLLVDSETREVFVGKYSLSSNNQRRLGLWSVNLDSREAKCLVNTPGSFKPLIKKDNRIFFVSLRNGLTRIMSVNPLFRESEQVEYVFPDYIRPLDICLDGTGQKMYYVFENSALKTKLSMIKFGENFSHSRAIEMLSFDGRISSLTFYNNNLWFAAENNYFLQLYKLNTVEATLEKYTNLPGGVWDINFSDSNVELITLNNNGFRLVRMPEDLSVQEATPILAEENISDEIFSDSISKPYSSIYKTGYWSPLFSEDEQGMVFGIRSFQKDLLGRSECSVSPTYGFKSQDWGYLSSYMQRMGIMKATVFANRITGKRDYLGNKYYERNERKKFELECPLNLATNVSAGVDLVERSMTKYEFDITKYPSPSAGQDNSFFINLSHKAVKTQPFHSIFPRKGRDLNVKYSKGQDWFGGDMEYYSWFLNWAEYTPLSSNLVLTCKAVIGEDSKEDTLRRPQDLAIGGENGFMRALPSGYKTGDRLRVFSSHLGLPINFRFPRMISWIYNEFTVAEIYFEMGDVIDKEDFDWLYNRGIEFRSKILLLKRLPVVLKTGYAIQNGGKENNSYALLDFTDLSKLFE